MSDSIADIAGCEASSISLKLDVKLSSTNKPIRNDRIQIFPFCYPNKLMDLDNDPQWLLTSQKERLADMICLRMEVQTPLIKSSCQKVDSELNQASSSG